MASAREKAGLRKKAGRRRFMPVNYRGLIFDLAVSPVESSGGLVVLLFFVCIVPTALVWRAMTPYGKPPAPDWRSSRAAEVIADLCLFAYMLVNLAVWNTVTAGSAARVAGVGD